MTDLDLTLPTPGVTKDWGDIINTALEALQGEINGRLGESQLAGTIGAAVTSAQGVDMCADDTGVTGNDWTARLQALVDDTDVESIVISQPIRMSTVTIPANRPLRVVTPIVRNITGTPIITLITGGEGFKFTATLPSLAGGCSFENLSFTSEGAVAGAFTGENVTGCRWENIFFEDVQGAAFDIEGVWQDCALNDITAMDCGDTSTPVVGIGETGEDPNRLTWNNLRIERAASTLVEVRGNAYSIDFMAAKLHADTDDGAPILTTETGCQGINVIGGQLRVSADTPGMYLRGNRHNIIGLSVQGTGGVVAGSKAIYGDAGRSTIQALACENVETPVELTGTGNTVTGGSFAAASVLSLGTMGLIEGCYLTNLGKRSDLAYNVRVGTYGRVAGVRMNVWTASLSDAVLANAAGVIVEGVMVFRNADFGPTDGVQVSASNVTAKNNMVRGATNAVNNSNPADTTRIVADNTLVPI